MKTRAELLALRRQMLVAECNAQRADLALQVLPLAYTLSSVNIGMRILDRVRKHPGWIAALALGLIAVRPRRLTGFFRLGSTGLRVWRHVQPLMFRQLAQQEFPHVAQPTDTHDASKAGLLRPERKAQIW